MGQSASAEEVVSGPPTTPPEVEDARRRQEYLHKLGIGKDGKPQNFRMPPAQAAEAPATLEHPRAEGEVTEEAPEIEKNSSAASASSASPGHEEFDMTMLDIKKKGQDDFRMGYLKKLSYTGVWVPQAQRPPKHQTVIIFDWDDTLLCTSYLNLRSEQPLPPGVWRQLNEIQAAGAKLLEMAMKMGDTFIITNAMNGWVEWSAAKWVPDMLPVLRKVQIISARTNYEQHFPGEVSQWKIQAFLEVQRKLNSEIITNLISLGDSNFEMDAVHVMGKEFSQALVKTIKFRENPKPEELLKQLELVGQKFERIVENARNLKIGLERKWVGPGGGGPGAPQMQGS